MIQKKICMLGSFSVGKTSLVRRYVTSLFSDKYHTTVGVKVDKKQIQLGDRELMLMLWDIAGEDAFSSVKPAQLRGMAGYVLVIDGTRQNSFDVAMSLHGMVKDQLGDIPAVIALNKADLKSQWVLEHDNIRQLALAGHPILETSAKLDQGVDDLFFSLARQLV